MPTGPAGNRLNLGEALEFGLADLHLVEKNFAGVERDAAQGSIADGARLLEDFLEHEVLEAALFGHNGVPGNVLHLPHHRLATGEVGQLHAARRDHRQVAIGQKEQVARVIQNGRNVGGHEVLVLSQPDDDGRAIAGGYDLVRLIGGNHRQREDSTDVEHRPANSFFQRNLGPIAAGQVFLDEMGKYFGVGLGQELVAFFAQLFFQAEVVLDNAVMHHDHPPGAVAMRMGILFRRPAMSRPTGVADAVSAIDRIQPDSFFQVAQLAFGAAHL